MDFDKCFRFHPTDEELIEYLRARTFDRDSLVQFIDEVQDICVSGPCVLAARATLQTGDRSWYFVYQPKNKHPNGKQISRTAPGGYWKSTGQPRKITNPNTGEEIGSKRTLVFYEGRYDDKNKIKTSWVMHEYELKPTPKANDSDHKTFRLCKLKKKADISSSVAGQSNQHSLSNLENHAANTAMSDPEASNDHDGVNNHCSSVELYAGDRSNQHNVVNEDANLYGIIEQDDESCDSVLTNYDETVSIERSNQHNIVVAAEGFEVPSILENLADEDLIPTALLYNDRLSLDKLLADPEAANNSNWIQKQYITNTENGEFLNSSCADNNEACLQEGNTQLWLPADTDNEGLGLPFIGVTMESFNSIEKSRKRPRLQYDGLNHHVETGEAQPWGEEFPSSSQSIQADSYNRMVIPQIGGSVTYASCDSVLTNYDETVSIERSNQHNIVVAAEGFEVPSILENLADEDLIPTALLYNDRLSLDKLLADPEAANNSNWIQKQYITNTENGEFLNSSCADNNEACLQEGNTQLWLPAGTDNEGLGLPFIGVTMESFNSIEKSRKRPRLQYDGLNHHVETGEAQPWGEEFPSSGQSIQADSYNRMVIPQIGRSVTYQY